MRTLLLLPCFALLASCADGGGPAPFPEMPESTNDTFLAIAAAMQYGDQPSHPAAYWACQCGPEPAQCLAETAADRERWDTCLAKFPQDAQTYWTHFVARYVAFDGVSTCGQYEQALARARAYMKRMNAVIEERIYEGGETDPIDARTNLAYCLTGTFDETVFEL